MSESISFEELEKQLKHPEGENGLKVAEIMFESNQNMIGQSLTALNLKDNESVLEIGHGNGAHLTNIFDKANGIKYVGLELSETMHLEALRLNSRLAETENLDFIHYDGDTLPFDSITFDKIFTVNTLYFWQDPVQFLLELKRVVKTNGEIIIAFAQKDFMKTLPFVNTEFTLYNQSDLELIVKKAGLYLKECSEFCEEAWSKSDEVVNREYYIAKVIKKV